MSIYNTAADAANTAVRAFLTQIGEYYLERSFNSGSGKSKSDWERIKTEIFNNLCAYCGKEGQKLQMDHLIMFNRTEFGLHHPGNIVPACNGCNSRSKKEDKTYSNWEEHLSYICEKNNEKDKFYDRWKRIKYHITESEFKYPVLSDEEKKAIQIIANNLYDNVKTEFEGAIKLYEELDKAFSKRKNS
ncbi:MAG TPA: HNH endonuclease signature motif containing protein [Flavobacteriales bacterium]|nr:HNH endonuclease [Flavobacterium sp.]HRE73686.1 HNH endonuclease signature motif containing protein [Flavobacteriales bacterium]HRE95248.1 HNH endonuclease signature motif containing protein [Flavobacteriales bacterium]HRJ37181.1 HNH endonuclease signature motif containing protein [Flavobacteriales bacterium]